MPLQGSTSIERMCQLAQVSRAGFYRFLQDETPVEEDLELRHHPADQPRGDVEDQREDHHRRRELEAQGERAADGLNRELARVGAKVTPSPAKAPAGGKS